MRDAKHKVSLSPAAPLRMFRKPLAKGPLGKRRFQSFTKLSKVCSETSGLRNLSGLHSFGSTNPKGALADEGKESASEAGRSLPSR